MAADKNVLLLPILMETLDCDNDVTSNSSIIPVLALSLAIGHREQTAKIMGYVETVVPMYNFQQFKTFFRLSRHTFENLLIRISTRAEFIPRYPAAGRERISNEKILLMTLWYLANHDSVRCIADRFNVSEATFIIWQRRVIDALCEFSHDVIRWPVGQAQRQIIDSFHRKYGFPGVLGAIDGTRIRIEAPSDHPVDYYNRKGYHSVVLQAVCREDRCFTNIYCGWPGKVHDARVSRNSPLYDMGPNLCGMNHLLGDGAYPVKSWLLVPYRDNGHLTEAQKTFNKKLSQIRVAIEQTFGILKGRFQRLQYVMVRDIENIVKVVVACCALHNICILNDDELEDIFSEDEVNGINVVGANDDVHGEQKRISITDIF